MAQLDFSLEEQQRDNWCWAAVGAAVAAFCRQASYGQCDVANAVFAVTTCCTDGNACDQDESLRDVLRAIGDLNSVISAPVSYEDVCNEIDAGRPLGVRVRSGTLGHFIVISGYDPASADRRLTIDDPGYGRGRSSVPYDTLLTNYYGSGVWTHTYYVR